MLYASKAKMMRVRLIFGMMCPRAIYITIHYHHPTRTPD